MSYISEIEGRILYETEEAFEQGKETINSWSDEVEFNTPSESESGLFEIVIELKTYRNLGRNIENAFETASSGFVIGTSNDVTWHGSLITTSLNLEQDLTDWADQNRDKYDLPEEPNPENTELYTEYQMEVEAAFREHLEEKHDLTNSTNTDNRDAED